MAITLESLKPTTEALPPRILIYGPPGIGKTSLALEFPNPVLVRVEDGVPDGAEVMAFPLAETFGDVMEALGVIYNEETGAQTLVVDSVTELQRLIFAEACARGDEHGNVKTNIEAFGYGRGYKFAEGVLSEFMQGINLLRRERGLTVVLIAHSAVARHDDPESESYDRYQVDLHKALVGTVEREMDGIFLLKMPIEVETEKRGLKGDRNIAKSNRIRKIYTEGAPAYVAKNRFGKMPSELRFDLGKGYSAIAKYLPAQPNEDTSETNSEKDAA